MIASIKIALLSFASLLIGTIPAPSTAPGQTPYEVGPGHVMRDFVYTGANTPRLSQTDYFVIDLPVLAYATSTGSSTIGYRPKAICIPNPLTKLRRTTTGSGSTPNVDRGSGAIAIANLHILKNPMGVGGDLGFSTNCLPATASGTQLADNVNSATGSWTKYFANGTTAADWNGAHFLTLTLRSNPGTGFRASLFLSVIDNGAE